MTTCWGVITLVKKLCARIPRKATYELFLYSLNLLLSSNNSWISHYISWIKVTHFNTILFFFFNGMAFKIMPFHLRGYWKRHGIIIGEDTGTLKKSRDPKRNQLPLNFLINQYCNAPFTSQNSRVLVWLFTICHHHHHHHLLLLLFGGVSLSPSLQRFRQPHGIKRHWDLPFSGTFFLFLVKKHFLLC